MKKVFNFKKETIKTLMEMSEGMEFVEFHNISVFDGDQHISMVTAYKKSPKKFINSIRRRNAIKLVLNLQGYLNFKIDFKDYEVINRDRFSRRYAFPNIAYMLKEVNNGFIQLKGGLNWVNYKTLGYPRTSFQRFIQTFIFYKDEFLDGGTFNCQELDCSEWKHCKKRDSLVLTYIDEVSEDDDTKLVPYNQIRLWFVFYCSLCRTVLIDGYKYIDLYSFYELIIEFVEDVNQRQMLLDIIKNTDKHEFIKRIVDKSRGDEINGKKE